MSYFAYQIKILATNYNTTAVEFRCICGCIHEILWSQVLWISVSSFLPRHSIEISAFMKNGVWRSLLGGVTCCTKYTSSSKQRNSRSISFSNCNTLVLVAISRADVSLLVSSSALFLASMASFHCFLAKTTSWFSFFTSWAWDSSAYCKEAG